MKNGFSLNVDEFFFTQLPHSSKIVLKEHDTNDESVNLAGCFIAPKEMRDKTIRHVDPEKNRCYYTPVMEDVNIILTVDDETFLNAVYNCKRH